jgi:hypothetical protein
MKTSGFRFNHEGKEWEVIKTNYITEQYICMQLKAEKTTIRTFSKEVVEG